MTSLSLPGAGKTLPPGVLPWFARNSFAVRLTVALVAIAGAYHYSLLTLVRALGLETPLAYLGLVPAMALGLALVRARPRPDEPTIHDRQIDMIVGIPLLAAALAMTLTLPNRMETLFWVYRVDLLSLPLFVAGVVTLLFGVRTLWRMRVAVVFLLLAWPLPWTALLARWLDGFTDLTVQALKVALTVVPVGAPTPGSDGSLFSITHQGQAFVVSVASACSGVNGVVGFLLVGVACTVLVKGKRLPKLLWLLCGVALIWALNVVRLLAIFWGGQTFGEAFAIEGLHPVIGLILFCAGIAAMAVAMPWFGLTLPAARKPAAPAPAPASGAVAAIPVVPYHRVAVPRARGAIAVLLATAGLMGVSNAGMRDYQLFAGDLGAPRLVGFTAGSSVTGYAGGNVASYPWAQRFFGDDSTWLRYSYRGTTPQAISSAALTVDVVSTSKLARLTDYGIEACYRFHGYDLSRPRSVELSGGVKGSLLSYTDPEKGQRWDVLHWIWPVAGDNGTRYERVALLMAGGSTDGGGPAPRNDPGVGSSLQAVDTSAGSSGGAAAPSDAALTAFANVVIDERPQAGASTGRTAAGPPNGTSVVAPS